MDVLQYLDRIRYKGSLEPNADTLRALQLAHLQTIPFENLSIHSKEPIVLDDSALFDKIVNRRRGGFCYELNGLFSWLLRELGFDVVKLSAGVVNSEGEMGPEFDHMTLLVNLEERWIADVGFGDSFVAPLKLDTPDEQQQGGRSYKIELVNERYLVSQREAGGDWRVQYSFSLQPYDYEDYADMCLFHQTSPQSHFTKKRLCSMLTPAGRSTVSGLTMISTSTDGTRTERQLNNEDEFEQTLREQFGISGAFNQQ